MYKKITALFLTLVLCWGTVGCGSTPQATQNPTATPVAATRPSLPDGRYPVQQATYDDATGEYSLMLLNTPPGTRPVLQTAELQLARLTEEQLTAGEKTYLDASQDRYALYLSEDFPIEYVHAVTDTRVNPQTGQPETVIVERRSSFWTPFAGALAGQALGSLLFTPRYYFPPPYQPGVPLTGYGGYGQTYQQAASSYQSRHNSPPPAVRNRQTLRTTGRLRRSPTPTTTTTRRTSPDRPTGSGFGSNTLRSSGKSGTSPRKNPSFGSRSSSPRRSFSRSGRRR